MPKFEYMKVFCWVYSYVWHL